MDTIRNRLYYYGKNTNLHGIKYVVDETKHPLIRFLWMFIFISSLICMFYFIRTSYNAYRYNAISFVTETTYLDWETNFPAITICETTTQDIATTMESNVTTTLMSQFITDIIFFTGSCYTCSSEDVEKFKEINLKDLVKRYRKSCNEILGYCKWNNVQFNCCELFMPFSNEYGVCFSINSLHTNPPKEMNFTLISNRKTGPGELMIQTLVDVRLHIHASEDVPYINSDPEKNKDIMARESTNITLEIIELENDENVKTLPIESRGCKFPWENDDLLVHNLYSYSSCIVQCRVDAHYRLCNCTHHLMPVLGEEKYCDIDGLQCLTDNFETLNRLHAKGYDKPGLVCECLPSCVEPEYKIVLEQKGRGPKNSETIIRMQTLPTSRFNRIVVRTTLDLVVQIGSAIGLFIGGSLLSIIESVYLLIIRRIK